MAEVSDMWHLIPAHLVSPFLLCPVVLNAPDTVLIERNVGKRIDPVTGGMTHPRDSKTGRECPCPTVYSRHPEATVERDWLRPRSHQKQKSQKAGKRSSWVKAALSLGNGTRY